MVVYNKSLSNKREFLGRALLGSGENLVAIDIFRYGVLVTKYEGADDSLVTEGIRTARKIFTCMQCRCGKVVDMNMHQFTFTVVTLRCRCGRAISFKFLGGGK